MVGDTVEAEIWGRWRHVMTPGLAMSTLGGLWDSLVGWSACVFEAG